MEFAKSMFGSRNRLSEGYSQTSNAETLSEDEEDKLDGCTSEGMSVAATGQYIFGSSNSSNGYTPSPGGPFSALTPSMWPQDILSSLAQPEDAQSQPDYRYDEFGFRVEEEDGPEQNSSKLLSIPFVEDAQHRLKWIAHLEFTHNNEVEDLTWDKVEPRLPRSDKLKNMVREGIPHSLRPQMWMRLSGGLQKKINSDISYKDVVKASSNDHLMTSKQIEKDLLRTMPSNVCFSNLNSTGVPRLRRILRGIAWLYPDIGYCQGTGVIAASLLLFMEEEEAFWMMCTIVEDLLPASYYSSTLIGVQADQRVLRTLICSYLTDVDVVLKEHDIELSLITLHWFLTVFASVVHMKILLRIWDLFLYDGSIVLFQITLGMLKMKEPQLKGLENSAQIFNALSDIPGDIDDVDYLLEVSENLTSSLVDVLIDTHRRKHLAYLMAEQGTLVNPESSRNLPKQHLNRRHIKRSKSVIQLFLFGEEDSTDDVKCKNIRQTEILVDLRESILQVSRHFLSIDPKCRSSLVPDYSMESHALDHEHFANVSRNKQRRAKALLDFERHDDDELGFRRNDIITILSQKDEHCWIGELNGLRGWFPAKFVELLDERSKQYSSAGDDGVTETITDLVRGTFCPAFKAVLEHGMKKSNIGSVCHPWLFVEEAAAREVEKDFNSVYSRLVLCKTYRLDEDGKVLTPEEVLYRSVQAVNLSHNSVHAQMDVKLRSLICMGLNEQVLHLWFEVLCSSINVVEKWYHPWSFINSPGWVQIKCELRILSQFAFNLSPDWELPQKREQTQPLKEGKDFHYEFTECDENNGRWRVSVPKPNTCTGGLPNAPRRVKCGIACDAGSYYNTTSLDCSTCPPGTYSLGGAARFNSWESVPEEFLIESEPFKSFILTSSDSPKTEGNCTLYGWQPKGKAIASFGGPCVSTMSYSVKLVKPGYLIYKYQYTDKNVMFSFKVQNEQCHTIQESEKYKWPPATEKYQWETIQVDLKPGINILYWKTIGMDMPKASQAILISDIEVMGVAYTSKCSKCEAGSYSTKLGSTECTDCPANTYSTTGVTTCTSCDSETQYAHLGSSECKKRLPCTESDYYQYNSPCNSNKKTQIMYKWIEPKICRDDISEATQLPPSGSWGECPPCNPGMTYSHNTSDCVFCPSNTYSDGGSACKTCPVSTAPNYGYQYKWWNSFPPNMVSDCISYDFDTCQAKGGWKLERDFVKTSDGNAPNSYLLLTMDVPEFRGHHIQRESAFHGDVGHVDFVFETSCESNCEFAFMMSNSKTLVVVEKWEGTQSKQHFRYVVVKNDSYTFSWSFRKVPDDKNYGFISDKTDFKMYENDFAKIYVINVTDTVDGGASSCLSCPKGTKDDGCIPCPPGHYISSDMSCVHCPPNTIIESHGMPMGNDSCKPCGLGLTSTDGQNCYSDCNINFGNQQFDFNFLPKSVLVKGQPLFSSSGTHYYHLFNISLCGKDQFATCSDNVTTGGFKANQFSGKARSHVCRSTMIPVVEHGVSGFMTTMSVSLGDVLIGISTKPSYQNITVGKEFLKGKHQNDIHYFYKSPEATHACKQGRSTTITLRCDRNQKGNGTISVPSSCGDGTCDGCHFHFLWETRLACPLCTKSDFQVVKGECQHGEQLIHYIPSSHCLLSGGKDEAPPTRKICEIIPQLLQVAIGLIICFGILLLLLVCYFWKKNRKLEYKYMKLIQSNTDKEGELPIAESCGIEDDEYLEDEQYDNIEYNKGKGLLGKIRAMTGSNTKNEADNPFETIQLTEKEAMT
ncbi:Small G protein signaling modulator 3 [Nymphon striatum]|nr:Small G protein signaling modulator 3 [Nymphon striatum]